jgi:hypothetical protein
MAALMRGFLLRKKKLAVLFVSNETYYIPLYPCPPLRRRDRRVAFHAATAAVVEEGLEI